MRIAARLGDNPALPPQRANAASRARLAFDARPDFRHARP
jgi:hypothetical protein